MEAEQRIVKRLLDIVLALVFIVLLSPVLAVTALIVLADGKPLLHPSERVTKNGRHFRMLKFRTVRKVKEDGTLISGEDGDSGGVIWTSCRSCSIF